MELQGKRVAVLVEDNYADLELWYLVLRVRAQAQSDDWALPSFSLKE